MTVFDPREQERLLNLLAASGFAASYRDLCLRYPGREDDELPPDPARLRELFEACGAMTRLHKRYKVVEFDAEEIGGWHWVSKLHVQRHGLLEPLLEASKRDGEAVIGSTWLSLALDSGGRTEPPLAPAAFLPPVLPFNRPRCGIGAGESLRFVADLLSLFRSVKEVIRRGW